ncbi:hypothetical protein LTR36_005476 [Oleoguttula mirabilis]|uniref:Uncharacterized protein n=1 Tax=Oleoguttula mirabilis TaxID=1507867 RepID=A0AAV9JEH2_9PEZI|nr:hypothetical protein LTR36_005476 [Oleoguttula mirabilis]
MLMNDTSTAPLKTIPASIGGSYSAELRNSGELRDLTRTRKQAPKASDRQMPGPSQDASASKEITEQQEKLTWTKAHADYDAAHAHIHGEPVKMQKVNVNSDDWGSIGGRRMQDLGAELLDALQTEPDGPEDGWTASQKAYARVRYAETMRTVNSVLDAGSQQKRIEANICLLLKEVRNLHEFGMPESMFDKTRKTGYKAEVGMTCSERVRRVAEVASKNPYIKQDLLRDASDSSPQDFIDLARSPYGYLKRKLTNVKSNGNKPIVSDKKVGGIDGLGPATITASTTTAPKKKGGRKPKAKINETESNANQQTFVSVDTVESGPKATNSSNVQQLPTPSASASAASTPYMASDTGVSFQPIPALDPATTQSKLVPTKDHKRKATLQNDEIYGKTHKKRTRYENVTDPELMDKTYGIRNPLVALPSSCYDF